MFRKLKLLFLSILPFGLFAQGSGPQIILPKTEGWNKVSEGDTVRFSMFLSPDSLASKYRFEIQQGSVPGMNLDSLGNFTWTPWYYLVSRVEQKKVFQVIVEAKDHDNNRVTANINFEVTHTNRPPIVTGLKIFYIQFNHNNVYTLTSDIVYDQDNDPIVFIPDLDSFPEGMSMTNQGEISWSPSLGQFKALQKDPLYIRFSVQDQPAKSITEGKIKVEVTQMDLPPQITVIPKNENLKIRENETINLRFYLSDPNGEDDIEDFGFVTNIADFPKSTLVKNSGSQYEFTWSPGYDFVKDPADSLNFFIDFFVIDKTQNREVKRINFNVLNTVNEAELDKKNFNLYLGALVDAWELLEQLKEKEEILKKDYKRASKGKKNRSVITASMGATTGLSPVIARGKPDAQKAISAVGGTATLTISTLEATEVIGRSMKDLIDRLNYIIEKKNEIQTKGDIFARDYSLKAARRNKDYLKKIDEFKNSMGLKGLVALELNASWENKKQPTESNIKKTFKDFVSWE